MNVVILADPIEMLEKYELYRVISDWDALHEGFRDRVDELEITRTEVDAAGKLQPGYASKILCDPPMRSFGRESLPRMLRATGMALVLVIDDERFAPVKERLSRRKRPLRSIVRKAKPAWLFTRDRAREISTNRWKDVPPDIRRKMMKKATKAAARAKRLKAKSAAKSECVAVCP